MDRRLMVGYHGIHKGFGPHRKKHRRMKARHRLLRRRNRPALLPWWRRLWNRI